MGILNPLYTAVSWIIVQFHSLFSPIFGKNSGWSWGLSIVCLVVVIRICLIPLFVKQIKATRGLQALQPRIKEVQKRYKDDRERQSQEMMKLYKETGTNPLSSCLPILVQSPFFFALFHVLQRVSQNRTVGVIDRDLVNSAQQAHIFGAPIAAKFTDSASKISSLGADLTTVRIVTVVMIILMSGSQFFTQRQLMTKNTDPASLVGNPFAKQQKLMMYAFPIMFAVFGINFPVGVLVYWLTTNVWTMGQQLFVINRNPTPGSPAFKVRQEKLAEKARKQGKVLLPDGKLMDQAEYDAQQAEIKAQAARRQQPTRLTKSQRKARARDEAEAAGADAEESADADTATRNGSGTPARSNGAVKGSTARTPHSGARNAGPRRQPQGRKHPRKK
ncbi:membrane protein insertase YidC [Embleya scabrispora]|uniref:Membrane protein insertase YidC n=1 Tax=Embleya scabrispora TaxID=159449 RepID=A0A1T3NYY7_9ACTN|nr:membrane protein insertase YidC [Embleya scabrispora]OPC82038.1 membrane protein insertase YidC [Embleya scabrispora]